ncbi:Protein of unknown function [Halopseudomonas xinjiangensis]|uniref:DUF3530 family protein n=1 Tax=Halopseudomonas xinjiangensis TaxID=487184 RepID=A0A1H1L2G2_9GAMM|nr:DUF3530 family protein [Halopseudomonas xinjiangensis]SDR68716.1 Protein of unknown function [Halopseudomonas xinjiangensis]
MGRLLLVLLMVCSSLQAQTPEAPQAAEASQARPDLSSRSSGQEQALQRQIPPTQQRQLGEGESAFLGLFLPAARPDPLGSVLVVADLGEHANWPELIEPARANLSEAGWNTLAIGLPEAPPSHIGAADDDSAARQSLFEQRIAERLELGLALLAETGAAPVAVIARGRASYWVLQQADALPAVSALIVYQPRPAGPERPLQPLLETWDKPLLDIATKGALGRSDAARERQLIAQRTDHPHYRQILVSNPGNTPQTQQMLIKRIEGWLRKLPAAQRNPR